MPQGPCREHRISLVYPHFAKANGWASSFDEEEISRLVERAADVGTDDAVALCWAGHVHAYFFRDLDRALLLIDRALELEVNLAVAWQRSGWVRGYAGDPNGAIESLTKAIRLNPLDPRFSSHKAPRLLPISSPDATTMQHAGPPWL